MPLIKTDKLTQAQLDYLITIIIHKKLVGKSMQTFFVRPYSTDWAAGGPLFSEAGIGSEFDREWGLAPINSDPDSEVRWMAHPPKMARASCYGPTELMAKARAYVKMHQGDEVEIPQILC
jgi:hypothetical protein